MDSIFDTKRAWNWGTAILAGGLRIIIDNLDWRDSGGGFHEGAYGTFLVQVVRGA